jgi:alkylation response protein AidB-like acyl-CoA dehydrogenase
MLADMATRLEAARLLVYRACSMLDEGAADLASAAAMAKLAASDAAMQITTDSVQVLGGAGYTREFPVERMLRDAKITQIYEGTNQIQRIVIARSLLDRVAARGGIGPPTGELSAGATRGAFAASPRAAAGAAEDRPT